MGQSGIETFSLVSARVKAFVNLHIFICAQLFLLLVMNYWKMEDFVQYFWPSGLLCKSAFLVVNLFAADSVAFGKLHCF